MIPLRRTLLTLSACAGLFGPALLPSSAQAAAPEADQPRGWSRLEDAQAPLPTALAKARGQAEAALRSRLGPVRARLDFQADGSFGLLRNADVGRPLIPGFARLEPKAAEQAARGFISQYRGLFGLSEADLATLRLDRAGVIGRTAYARGIYVVSFVQQVDGVRVQKARVTFALQADRGDLYAVTSSVFGAPQAGQQARLTPVQAVGKALETAGVTGKVSLLSRKGLESRYRVEGGQVTGPVSLEKRWLASAPGRLEPGYVAWVDTRGQGLLEVGVSGLTGAGLYLNPRTAGASYAMSGWATEILQENGTIAAPTLMTLSPDTSMSPAGWVSPKGTDGLYRTVGPNVITFYDWAGDYESYDWTDSMRPLAAPATYVSGSGASEVITFDYTPQWAASAGDPTAHVQLSQVEIFRLINQLHDRYARLGFTSAQGNFEGDDPVLVNVQDGYELGRLNNANFSTRPDGQISRMNMYIFDDETGELRDGGIDRHIVSHELGHGLSHRLVNFGDNYLYGQQSGALGEGTSDVFAFFTVPQWSTAPDTMALAPYVAWENFSYYVRSGPVLVWTRMLVGPFANDITKPMGRFTAYTEELGDEFKIRDPGAQRTLEHFGFIPVAYLGEGATMVPKKGLYGNWTYVLAPETHSDGEIWAAAAWRVKLRVAAQTWSTSSSSRLLGLEQTFLMGMQLMPSNPNFIQARDALIIYEEMTQTESAACMFKAEFARTGMGRNAYAGTSGSYGRETDYDEAAGNFPEILPDFDAWGCAAGTYNQSSGEVTMVFRSEWTEVEVGQESWLEVQAATPGYKTSLSLTGPYVGNQTFQSSSDTLIKKLNFTVSQEAQGTLVATVSSSQGQSQTQSLPIRGVIPVELDPAGDEDSSTVEEGVNNHYALNMLAADFAVGDGLVVSLTSLDGVDIDLYLSVDSLALPYWWWAADADTDGNETLTVQHTADGWQATNGSGSTYVLVPEAEDFRLYLDVNGFQASAYNLSVVPL